MTKKNTNSTTDAINLSLLERALQAFKDKIQAIIDEKQADTWNDMFPVGGLYLSKVDRCEPAYHMPGTNWQRLAPNRMLRIMENTSLGGGIL